MILALHMPRRLSEVGCTTIRCAKAWSAFPLQVCIRWKYTLGTSFDRPNNAINIDVFPQPLNITHWVLVKAARKFKPTKSYVGPIIKLIQFRLKRISSSMWSLNSRVVGVRETSCTADHANVAFLNPILSAETSSTRTGRNCWLLSVLKWSRTSVSWRKSLRRSNDTFPVRANLRSIKVALVGKLIIPNHQLSVLFAKRPYWVALWVFERLPSWKILSTLWWRYYQRRDIKAPRGKKSGPVNAFLIMTVYVPYANSIDNIGAV